MNIALRVPRMSREEFFAWAEAQNERYEFDGFEPVAMTGGNNRHSQIGKNILRALDLRLRGGCRALGPDAGVRTEGDAVRYPDAVVTCAKIDDLAHEVAAPVVVFEVLSPTSGYTDCVVKLREYHAVASIQRYVIVEYTGIGVTLHVRAEAGWTTTALTDGETLVLPEIGVELPVTELYLGTDLAAVAT